MRFWLERVALLGTSLLIGILLGEGLTRLYYGFKTEWTTWHSAPVMQGEVTTYDSLLGRRLMPNAKARFRGPHFDTEIAINSQGLRMDHDVSYRKVPGTRRILLFGDSFTMGHGVDVNERFGERIESIFQDVEVINFGVGGTGTDQQYLLYREAGVRFDADLVILCYLVENIIRNASAIFGTAKPRFVLTDGRLELTNVPVPNMPRAPPEPPEATRGSGVPIPFKNFLRQHSELYKLARGRAGHVLHGLLKTNPTPYPAYQADHEAWQVTAALLKEFGRATTHNGSAFAVVIIPTHEFVYVDHIDRRPNDMLLRMGNENDIPVLDLLPALKQAARQSGVQFYFDTDRHWNPEGHRAAAEVIAAYLVDHFEWLEKRVRKDVKPTVTVSNGDTVP